MAAERIPELREADAPPQIQAIYDDIRAATGIPQVNLIFRHLALWPEVLFWAWETVAPAYRSGEVAATLGRLEAELSVSAQAPLSEALADPSEAASLGSVLDFYNRGNGSNLIGLTALLQVAERRDPASRAEPTPAAAPQLPALGSVPPLPRREKAAPEILALIDELSERQSIAGIGVTPSLYLHLALWPAAVRRAHATIGPMLGTPEWQACVTRLIAASRALAAELAADLRAPTARPPSSALRPCLDTVLLFVERPIPQMLLVGHILAGRGTGVSN